MVRRPSAAWEQLYAQPVYLAETFVDPARHRGTCYRAANWRVLGRTTGRGHTDHTHRVKAVARDPSAWMPWNYEATLAAFAPGAAPAN
jgi:hypothetical protein